VGDDLFEAFVDLVADRRELSDVDINAVADGRIFAGARAIELKLVDAIGDERTAREWLSETHGIETSLPIGEVTWGDESPWDDPLSSMLGAIGGKPLFSERLKLDGVMSVWHASGL